MNNITCAHCWSMMAGDFDRLRGHNEGCDLHPENRWNTVNWQQITCPECRGHGVVSGYTPSGSDFTGPADCPVCGGNGSMWRSPQGRIADYPGGPFRGRG